MIIVFFTFYACRDENLIPAPDINDPSIVGAVTLVTTNPDRLFFNALNYLYINYLISFLTSFCMSVFLRLLLITTNNSIIRE